MQQFCSSNHNKAHDAVWAAFPGHHTYHTHSLLFFIQSLLYAAVVVVHPITCQHRDYIRCCLQSLNDYELSQTLTACFLCYPKCKVDCDTSTQMAFKEIWLLNILPPVCALCMIVCVSEGLFSAGVKSNCLKYCLHSSTEMQNTYALTQCTLWNDTHVSAAHTALMNLYCIVFVSSHKTAKTNKIFPFSVWGAWGMYSPRGLMTKRVITHLRCDKKLLFHETSVTKCKN